MLIMAYSGGLRLVEDYSLEWADLRFKTNPTEISVTLKRTKGNAEGRYFLITNLQHLEIILKYRLSHLNSKQKDTGPLYRCWSSLGGKWSTTRRGRRWFQDVPKKVAKYLKKNEAAYTHHSLRRSMASQLHTNGATRLSIKYAGGWRCDKVVEGYVISSVGEKRRTAQMVSHDVAVDSIMRPKKKTAADTGEATEEAEPKQKPADPKKKDYIEKEMQKVIEEAEGKKQLDIVPSSATPPTARDSVVVKGVGKACCYEPDCGYEAEWCCSTHRLLLLELHCLCPESLD